MRIALIIEQIEPWRGGAETSTAQFLAHLLERGVDVHLLTRSEFPSAAGLTVHRVAAAGGLRFLRTRRYLREAQSLCESLDVDLVHAIVPSVAADVYEPRSGTVVETMQRNVAIRRGVVARALKRFAMRFNLRQRIVLAEERRLLARPDPPHLIAISSYVERQLKEHFKYDSSRVTRIFNGVDPVLFDERIAAEADRIRESFGAGADGRFVLVVANNFRLKGVDRAIEAIAQRNDLKTVLVVVGRDDARRCEALADRLGVRDRVHFAGATEDMPAFYYAADVLLHPTYYDPCSRVVLEALTAGLPCITTRCNGATDAIASDAQGLVVDSPEDVPAIVAALAHFLNRPRVSPEQRVQSTRDNAGLSMQRHTDEVIALYQQLIVQQQ